MGSRGCFRMILNRKKWKFAVPEALKRVIIKIDMGRLYIFLTHAFNIDDKSVVLGGYLDFTGQKILNGLI